MGLLFLIGTSLLLFVLAEFFLDDLGTGMDERLTRFFTVLNQALLEGREPSHWLCIYSMGAAIFVSVFVLDMLLLIIILIWIWNRRWEHGWSRVSMSFVGRQSGSTEDGYILQHCWLVVSRQTSKITVTRYLLFERFRRVYCGMAHLLIVVSFPSISSLIGSLAKEVQRRLTERC